MTGRSGVRRPMHVAGTSRGRPVDQRSDIYRWVVHQVLTGRVPFGQDANSDLAGARQPSRLPAQRGGSGAARWPSARRALGHSGDGAGVGTSSVWSVCASLYCADSDPQLVAHAAATFLHAAALTPPPPQPLATLLTRLLHLPAPVESSSKLDAVGGLAQRCHCILACVL
jgi:hypothetical protein